jgi:hypothetical protein
MGRLHYPTLILVVGIGIGLLGLLFGRCVFNFTGIENYQPRETLVCAGDLRLFGAIPYTWLITASICLVLYAIYLFSNERRG